MLRRRRALSPKHLYNDIILEYCFQGYGTCVGTPSLSSLPDMILRVEGKFSYGE